MGKSAFAKTANELDDIQKKAKRKEFQNQCDCRHTDLETNSPTLSMVKDKDGNSAFRCSQCKKIIPTKAPTAKDVDEALATIDSACDYAKMKADTRSEKAMATAAKMGEVQYNAAMSAVAYKQMLNDTNNKNDKYKNGQHNGGTTIHY